MSEEKTKATIEMVDDFIDDWVHSELRNVSTEFTTKDVLVDYVESDDVKTLYYNNKWYAWNIRNDFTIILIAFNDLEYKFNCEISFRIPDPKEEEEFYHDVINDATFEETVDFIKSSWYKHKEEVLNYANR